MTSERTVALDTHRNLRISNTLFVHNSTANNNLPSHTANTAPRGEGPQLNTRIHTAYVIRLDAPFAYAPPNYTASYCIPQTT